MLDSVSQGFGLHAAVRCGANERKAPEPLFRHITRWALANERVQINSAGQVVVKLKTIWHGITHTVMSPLEFMKRMVGIVAWRRMFVSPCRRSANRSEHPPTESRRERQLSGAHSDGFDFRFGSPAAR